MLAPRRSFSTNPSPALTPRASIQTRRGAFTATDPPAGWNTNLAFNDSGTAGWENAYSRPDNQIWLGSTNSASDGRSDVVPPRLHP